MDNQELTLLTPSGVTKRVYAPPTVTDLGDAVTKTLGIGWDWIIEGEGWLIYETTINPPE